MEIKQIAVHGTDLLQIVPNLFLVIDIHNCQFIAFLCQLQGYGMTDSPASAGYDCRFLIHCDSSLYSCRFSDSMMH